MYLNLNDPDSIVAWWQVYPDQHSAFLEYKLKASPNFAPAIWEAQRRIANDEVLSKLLHQSVQRRRHGEALRAECEGNVPAHELRWRELEAA